MAWIDYYNAIRVFLVVPAMCDTCHRNLLPVGSWKIEASSTKLLPFNY